MDNKSLIDSINSLSIIRDNLIDLSGEIHYGKVITIAEIPVIGDVVYIPKAKFSKKDEEEVLTEAKLQRKQIANIYRDRGELIFLLADLDAPPVEQWGTPTEFGSEYKVELCNHIFFLREDLALLELHVKAGLTAKHVSSAKAIKEPAPFMKSFPASYLTSAPPYFKREFNELMVCNFIKTVGDKLVLTERGQKWLDAFESSSKIRNLD